MKHNFAFIVGSLLLLGGGGIALASQSMSNTSAPPAPKASASEVGTRSSEGVAPDEVVWNNPDMVLYGLYGTGLRLTFTPDNPDIDINKEIKWTVTPSEVAEITGEEDGQYTIWGRKFGEATITGEAANHQILSGTVTVNGIEIERLHDIQFSAGDTKKISLTAYPEELGENVVWISSAPDIVSVDADGTIKCLSPGRARITARNNSNGHRYDSDTDVYVYPNKGEVAFVNKEEWLRIGAENPHGVNLILHPDDYGIQGEWNIADTQIAKFESTPEGTYCRLRPVNPGNTDLTFTNSGKTVTCKIHSFKVIESITPAVSEYSLVKGDTCRIELTVVPEDSNNPIIYTSDNDEIATVDSNGVITAVGLGTTSIECRPTREGIANRVTVIVQDYPESITVSNAGDFNLNIGDTRSINVKFTPEENVNRTVTWTVDNPEIAEVVASENEWDKNMYVKGLAYGKTIVRGETPNHLTTEFEVNVYGRYDYGENSYQLNADKKSINVGETFQIEIVGEDKGQTFTYSSDDENIATVDSNGLVTAVSYGETDIVVTPMPQGWPDRRLRVKVKKAPEIVEITSNDYLLTNPYYYGPILKFTPDNDDVNREITWSYEPEGVVEMAYLDFGKSYYIRPLTLGQATVTGITANGKELKFIARYEGVFIENKEKYEHATVGAEFDLPLSFSNTEISEHLTWWSDNPDLINVENGHVTCLKIGKALIYVDAEYDGVVYRDQIGVTSHPQEGQVGLSNPSLMLEVGERKYPESILPFGENNYNGIWSVADERIVQLDNKNSYQAWIEGITPGTTTLTYTMPDGRSASMEVTVFTPVQHFSLNSNEETLAKDQTFQIEVTNVWPEVENPRMIYTSENEEIAIVDESGLITAVGLGDARISVTPQHQDSPTQWLKVHVKGVPESVELKNSDIKFNGIGRRDYLNIVYSPDNENINKTIKWSYSKDGIINIDKYSWNNEYFVDSKDFGTVTFTGEAANGQIIEGTATVKGIVIEGDNPTYLNPGESRKFDLKASSTEILNSTTWGSYNSAVVEVDNNGNVTVIQPGSTEIYVNGYDETDYFFATKTITVYPEEGSVALTSPSLENVVGSSWNYLGVLLPEGDYNYGGVWSVSDESIIRFNSQYSSGVYYETIAAGTATITYTMEDGRSASCVVKVRGNETVDYISLNSQLEYGKIGDTFKIEATAYPEDYGKTIQYYSDNNEVATVDADGLVTYVGYGTAIVSAYLDNSEARLTVNVYEEPASATVEEGDEITVDTPQDLTPISIAFEAPEGVESGDICTDIVWEYSENGIDYSENGIIRIQKKLDSPTRARVRALGTRAADENAKTADFDIEALDFGTVEYKGYSPYDTEKLNPLVTGKVTIRGILLDNTYIPCYIDNETVIKVRTSGEDIANHLTVKADDKDIAKVESNADGTYTIQGLELGETWFNASAEVDGVTYSASANIFVMEDPAIAGKYESLSLDCREVALYIVDTKHLTATVINGYGNEVESPSISWTSSNTAVATVSDGVITPKDYGSTTITALVTDTFGKTLTETCEVNVIKFSTGGGNSGGGSGEGSGDEPDDPSGVDSLFGEEGTCDIYNVNGEVLKQNATKADFEALDKGIYIVRKDNKAVKVVK